jgi:hypothetical protein
MVLGFFVVAILLGLVILAVAPATFGTAPLAVAIFFVVALASFLVLIAIGVVRRWRWMFWLTLVAFLAGILRVPATVLELNGIVPKQGPEWYLVLQAAIGIVQFAIGVFLIRGYRKAGVWGAF